MLKIDLAGYRKASEPDEIESTGEGLHAEVPSGLMEEPVESPPETVPPDEPAPSEALPYDGELPFPDDEEPPLSGEEPAEADLEAASSPTMVFEEGEPSGSVSPEPPGEPDFASSRSERTVVEKVPLSSKGPLEPLPGLPPENISTVAETEPSAKGGSRMRAGLLVILLLIAAGYGIYTQRGRIVGFIEQKLPLTFLASKQKNVPAAPAPAAPAKAATDTASAPAAPVLAAKDTATAPAVPVQATSGKISAPAAPVQAVQPDKVSAPAAETKRPERPAGRKDPALAVLSGIRRAAPPRVWLIEASAAADGAYEMKGMSFSYEAMRTFSESLKAAGTVTAESLPARDASPETVYSFGISGKLRDIAAPGIFEAVPADRLAALGDSLKAGVKSGGIVFARLPRANAKYGEADLPFEAVGALDGIMDMLGGVTSSGKVAVYRIVVRPAEGTSADRIRAGFSLRAVPSL